MHCAWRKLESCYYGNFRKEGFTKTRNITICRMLIRAGKDTQTLETNANSLQLPNDTSKNNAKPNLLTANTNQSLWYKRCTTFRQACFAFPAIIVRNHSSCSIFIKARLRQFIHFFLTLLFLPLDSSLPWLNLGCACVWNWPFGGFCRGTEPLFRVH